MNNSTGTYNGSIDQFTLIGTNFTKADTQTRSRFAVTKATEADAYQKVVQFGFQDFFLLSTCNRTEFYACAQVATLKQVVTAQLAVSENDFNQYFYILTGIDAVRHFFQVVSGLDSQIIGDYEIVCQVKASLDQARDHNLVGTITDRISNFAYQAQKKVKAHTNLSSGKYSVSYAAAEMIFHESQSRPFSNILLIGAGDFGTTVARNLRHYFKDISITITNRTRENAETLATQVSADVIPFDHYKEHLSKYDVVIATVGLNHYLIQLADVHGINDKIFLDLSVPQAIHPDIEGLNGIRLFSVDEVSTFHNELLKQRKLEIPRAERIVDLYIGQLMEWHHVYNHRHIVSSYKEKVRNLMSDSSTTSVNNPDKRLDKAFSQLIREIREQGYAGCRVIETVNSLVSVEK